MAEELEVADRWKQVLSTAEIQTLERDFRCNQVGANLQTSSHQVMKYGGYDYWDFSADDDDDTA